MKPLSGTNAKNGAITLSLILTMHISHARCDEASEWVGGIDTLDSSQGNTCRTRMGGGSTEHVYACSGGVVVVALKDLVACEFSMRRQRGGLSVVLLSSFHPQFDDSNTSTRFVP